MFLSPQMYLVIFPEGTRYNPELKNVIDSSQAFAAKEGSVMMAAICCCILIQHNLSQSVKQLTVVVTLARHQLTSDHQDV